MLNKDKSHEVYYNGKIYRVIKNGTKEMPWNIYINIDKGINRGRTWLGCAKTMAGCKNDIMSGCFIDDIAKLQKGY